MAAMNACVACNGLGTIYDPDGAADVCEICGGTGGVESGASGEYDDPWFEETRDPSWLYDEDDVEEDDEDDEDESDCGFMGATDGCNGIRYD